MSSLYLFICELDYIFNFVHNLWCNEITSIYRLNQFDKELRDLGIKTVSVMKVIVIYVKYT